ncbi:MAG: NAD(P)/FAD-dependent oxidoreductase [Bacteroidales bacterium]
MIKQVTLILDPVSSADEEKIRKMAAQAAGVSVTDINEWRIYHRSVDARHRNIKVNLKILMALGEESLAPEITPFKPQNVAGKYEIIIVGTGPAGLFAALRLIELGLRPVLLERGNNVSTRKKDIAKISREHVLNPESNYCFGEGGAGTFSDGKLYTRSHKRGNNLRVFELLCHHGADRKILYDSHPHIGSDKLPGIIKKIRESITEAGGIILFGTKISDLIIRGSCIKGVITADNRRFLSDNVILATGHSARDVYCMLRKHSVEMCFKPFAAGVRVEHPQEVIDMIQYHGRPREKYLPPASYSVARQAGGRGVFSFCMCPGGFIIPSATSPDEVVVNGMSPSERNSPFASSGIVVEIKAEDLIKYSDSEEFAGMNFQKELERRAWEQGGKTQAAPAQRLADFINGRFSSTLPPVSYFPGVTSSPIHEWLPAFMSQSLKEGFKIFGKSMKGFLTNEAVILGVESRTSSPVRIIRNDETLEHIRISGLYPCGEGAGYAGGIVSSAVDGLRTAEAIAAKSGIKNHF